MPSVTEHPKEQKAYTVDWSDFILFKYEKGVWSKEGDVRVDYK